MRSKLLLNNNLLFLLTILQCIENIKIYVSGYKTHDDFLWGNDRRDFNASLMQLIAIGEETKKLDLTLDLRKNQPSVRWESVIGLRNLLSHEYQIVDSEIIWDTIKNHLGPLKSVCVELVYELGFDKEKLRKELQSPYYKHIQYLLN